MVFEVREGDAKRSSLSESERSNLPISGVDIFGRYFKYVLLLLLFKQARIGKSDAFGRGY